MLDIAVELFRLLLPPLTPPPPPALPPVKSMFKLTLPPPARGAKDMLTEGNICCNAAIGGLLLRAEVDVGADDDEDEEGM